MGSVPAKLAFCRALLATLYVLCNVSELCRVPHNSAPPYAVPQVLLISFGKTEVTFIQHRAPTVISESCNILRGRQGTLIRKYISPTGRVHLLLFTTTYAWRALRSWTVDFVMGHEPVPQA